MTFHGYDATVRIDMPAHNSYSHWLIFVVKGCSSIGGFIGLYKEKLLEQSLR